MAKYNLMRPCLCRTHTAVIAELRMHLKKSFGSTMLSPVSLTIAANCANRKSLQIWRRSFAAVSDVAVRDESCRRFKDEEACICSLRRATSREPDTHHNACVGMQAKTCIFQQGLKGT